MTRSSYCLASVAILFLATLAVTTATVETAVDTIGPAMSRPAAETSRPGILRPTRVGALEHSRAEAQKPQAPVPSAAEYAGEDTCLACHEDQSYKGTAHALTFRERTPAANQGCESCHGPGRAHAESGDPALIRRFDAIAPAEASDTCTTCHNRASHALWDGSAHDQRNISCTTCHSVHAPAGPAQLKAQTQMQLCSSCHRNVTSRQHRFSHMPVREGAMTCSSCHNVHGTQNIKLLRAGTTIDESCTSCHADKRGPFLWEHAPVSESCTTCHEPHGSNNDRLLVAKLPFLCQRCHVTSRHPTVPYDGHQLNNTQNANKIFGRGCTNCHQLVHGSNSPSGKAFLR